MKEEMRQVRSGVSTNTTAKQIGIPEALRPYVNLMLSTVSERTALNHSTLRSILTDFTQSDSTKQQKPASEVILITPKLTSPIPGPGTPSAPTAAKKMQGT